MGLYDINGMKISQNRQSVLLLLLGCAGLVLLFCVYGVSVWKGDDGKSLFGWLFTMWSSESSEAVDYSHGLVIPLVSVWLLWRQWDDLCKAFCDAQPRVLGVVLLAGAMALHFAGLRMQIPHASALGFVLALWSLGWTFGGDETAKLTCFPLAFLLFAIPIRFLARATFPLRLLGSVVATEILNGLGIATTRVGTAVYSTAGQGFALDVADACSGIRSIMALMALTAAYAYVFRERNWERWLLFAMSLPIAAMANIGRIVTIALVALLFGQDAGLKVYHDYSGYLVFVLTVLLVIGANAASTKSSLFGEGYVNRGRVG
jgi:exosortase